MTATWGMPEERTLPTAPLAIASTAALSVAVVIGLVVAALTTLFAGIVVFGVVMALATVWASSQGRLALARFDAVSADPHAHAGLINLVEGLARAGERETPEVAVLKKGEPNALVTRRRGRPVVAVTSTLLDLAVRTELEAVVAHCLVRTDAVTVRRASMSCCLGAFSNRLAPAVGYEDDVKAVALTRYPPALAKVLDKMVPAGPRFAAMWMVADDKSHRGVAERIAALGDL